jgi:hypothetical protein
LRCALSKNARQISLCRASLLKRTAKNIVCRAPVGSTHGKGLPPAAAPPAPPAAPHSPAPPRLDLHRPWHPTAWGAPFAIYKSENPRPSPTLHASPASQTRRPLDLSLRPRRPLLGLAWPAAGPPHPTPLAHPVPPLLPPRPRLPSFPGPRLRPRRPRRSAVEEAAPVGGPSPPGRTGGGGRGGWRPQP